MSSGRPKQMRSTAAAGGRPSPRGGLPDGAAAPAPSRCRRSCRWLPGSSRLARRPAGRLLLRPIRSALAPQRRWFITSPRRFRPSRPNSDIVFESLLLQPLPCDTTSIPCRLENDFGFTYPAHGFTVICLKVPFPTISPWSAGGVYSMHQKKAFIWPRRDLPLLLHLWLFQTKIHKALLPSLFWNKGKQMKKNHTT